MSAAHVRRYYGVPAKRGASVVFDGQQGVITSCPGAYIQVRLDGQHRSVKAHPTWRMRYLDNDQAVREQAHQHN